MTNATQGRRPTGPGWYWYRGQVKDAIDFYERTYDIQCDVDQPVWVQNDYDVYIPGWQKADGWKYLSDYATPSDMPGDFVPLAPPVAAPEPDLSVLGVTLDVIPSYDNNQRLLVSGMDERTFSVLATFKSVEAAEWFMRFWQNVRTTLSPPVAAPEVREPSWRDYESLTLHDLAWLREAAEEFEWTHRNDASVDIDRIRMVIRRLRKRPEVQGELP